MYDVGQVVFVISDKHKKVLPVRVVEQVVRRTLDGETVEYKVRGGNDKSQTYTLSSIGSQHFSSAEDVKNYMYENATTTINEIVGAALEVAQSKYGYQESIDGFRVKEPAIAVEPSAQADIFVTPNSENNSIASSKKERTTIKMPDGTYASVNVAIPGV